MHKNHNNWHFSHQRGVLQHIFTGSVLLSHSCIKVSAWTNDNFREILVLYSKTSSLLYITYKIKWWFTNKTKNWKTISQKKTEMKSSNFNTKQSMQQTCFIEFEKCSGSRKSINFSTNFYSRKFWVLIRLFTFRKKKL